MTLFELVDQYIAYRRSLGEKFKTNATCLKAFCKFIGPAITPSAVTQEMINNFLYGASLSITAGWFNKFKALNGFYKYALARNYVDKILLPTVLPKKPLPSPPYIYTQNELKKLFKMALNYSILKSHNSPNTVQAILVITYGLGLRISETLAITMGDLDLENAVITIRPSKFYKSRLIPYNSDMKEFLDKYLHWRIQQKQSIESDSPLFIGKNNLSFKRRTFNDIFQRIRKKAGIKRNDHSNYQPRIHDLRHTFAVNILKKWYQEKKDVQTMLPILSTYLGHERISNTTVYLTITNDLLNEANILFEKYIMGE